ncbi:MAG: hypothetical protein JM58_07160 [Peptococcaceae bacterium BICA1-8]|nr:MAG: hypothetical protein JM58_07160 [Peptococcaceae bacterium BICA1-8]
MKEILKPIFEWLTGNYNLFDNVLYNYLAMAIVGLLAFVVAWIIVGSLYKNYLISGRRAGSIIHWVVRFIAFVVIFSLISVIIWLVKFILSIPTWVWWALLGAFVLVIIGILVRHLLKKGW